jgi:Na+/proline symporter
MKLAPIDIAVIAGYMSVIAWITLRTRRFAGQSLENFFLGGRSMPGWLTGVSYAASMMSADSAVAYGGLAVITGVYVCWFYLSRFGIALFLGALLFAVYWRRLNTFTTLEFYELRFGGAPGTVMRVWLAFRTSLIAMVAWTGISLLALVKISEPVLDLSRTATLALALPLAVVYVFVSGYVGVVMTNLLQVGVMIVGAVVLAVRVLWAAGGPSELGAKLAAMGPHTLSTLPPLDDTVFPAVACLAWLLGASIGYGGDAAPMGGAVEGQRILSTRNPKEACKMYLVCEIVLFTMVWLVSVPCLAASIFWPQLRTGGMDRELAYGLLMTNYLSPGLLGLVYVAMLGGIISVVGDNLNFGSQVLLNDIYRRHLVRRASERHYMIAGRLAVFLILGLALLVVYRVTFLFDVAIFMVGLSATEMSANWAQWWWWRFNGWGRVSASIAGGLAYVAIVLIWPGIPWWTRMAIGMALATSFWIVATFATAPERKELLAAFYERARPPGAWGPIRAAAGEPPQHRWAEIGTGILLAILGASGVMAYIVGLSKLYVGSFAFGVASLAGAVLVAVAFWWRFNGYVRSLLSVEEQVNVDTPPSASNAFDLSALGSMLCFVVAAVLAIQVMLSPGVLASMASATALVCGIGGLYLRRRRLRAIRK